VTLAETGFVEPTKLREGPFLRIDDPSGPDFGDVRLGNWSAPPVVYLSAWRGEDTFPIPVKVELEVGEDGFLAFSPTLAVGGVGVSPAAAIDDLMVTADELHRELSSTPVDELHRTTRVSLERLRKFFNCSVVRASS
jgi:hypothetical protein